MSKNGNLRAAKKAKNDEFYTQRSDIEAELCHYAEHFRGKTVYCNCDDPTWSEFWKFFVRNFKPWGLKKLIATHYEPDAQNFSYKLELEPDADGSFSVQKEPMVTPLPCNGDFRSAACIELLQEADIVVTNPPFSLFREYVAQLMEYGKKFVIIGHKGAITYKEIFPLIKENRLWVGVKPMGGSLWFRTPEGFDRKSDKVVDGVKLTEVPCCWYTNLDYPKRHTPLDLRGNYYYGNEEQYPRYDNYAAIEVSKTADIPSDYEGVMGVPISFMDKYCPEQFEILGLTSSSQDCAGVPYTHSNGTRAFLNGHPTYSRCLILRRQPELSCVEEVVFDVYRLLRKGEEKAALDVALSLPDICGRAAYPEESCIGKRYSQWFDEYIGKFEKMPSEKPCPWLNGHVAWHFRNCLKHCWRTGIDIPDKPYIDEITKATTFTARFGGHTYIVTDSENATWSYEIDCLLLIAKLCRCALVYYIRNRELPSWPLGDGRMRSNSQSVSDAIAVTDALFDIYLAKSV